MEIENELSHKQEMLLLVGRTLQKLLRNSKTLQKVAFDIGLLEILVAILGEIDADSLENERQIAVLTQLLHVLAELTSELDAPRNKIAEQYSQKFALLTHALQSKNEELKISALCCL